MQYQVVLNSFMEVYRLRRNAGSRTEGKMNSGKIWNNFPAGFSVSEVTKAMSSVFLYARR